ncbi:unnamed protein product [Caenorhabditis bovis]|uniref:Uncharacterized protein n=1 Tax=Caenorhabditis bovis TaxID=2654633 RepID=A0A8S1EVJ9_9PELO|nr:unnamed protein product [Caenorhabditis bovis]
MPEVILNATNNARRQYRSVAFGTWQVGGARQLTERRPDCSSSNVRLKCSSPDLHRGVEPNSLLTVDKRHSRLGESSPNLSRIHHTHTQLSLGLPNKMSTSTTAHDFLSSSEYCRYVCSRDDVDSINGNPKAIEPIQAAFRKSRKDELSVDETKSARNLKYSQSSRRKFETATIDADLSADRAHHRSHSAGPHTAYSTAHTASTSEMNRSGVSRTDSNTTFLRATKRFFKKIYTSATLPKKQNSTSVDNFQKPSMYYEERNLKKVENQRIEDSHCLARHDLYDEDDDDTMRSENATMDISYPDSGFEMDRASTPEQSSVSMTSTSKSDDQAPAEMNFSNLFEQLKREMKEMRERDAQILADLHRVETQIQTVKQAQMLAALQDEFEPVESMQL